MKKRLGIVLLGIMLSLMPADCSLAGEIGEDTVNAAKKCLETVLGFEPKVITLGKNPERKKVILVNNSAITLSVDSEIYFWEIDMTEEIRAYGLAISDLIYQYTGEVVAFTDIREDVSYESRAEIEAELSETVSSQTANLMEKVFSFYLQDDEKAENEPESETESGKIQEPAGAGESVELAFPDPVAFSEYKITEDGTPSLGGRFYSLKYTCTSNDWSIMEDYLDLLTDGPFQLELIDTYEFDYNRENYFSYGYRYTGSGETGTIAMQFTDTPCNFVVWGTKTSSRYSFYLQYPMEMQAADLGYRYGGRMESLEPSGDSASAELIKNADGTYETSDGRLKAAPGEAQILRSGESFTGKVSLKNDRTQENKDIYWIEDYYRNEAVVLNIPSGYIMSGDVFGMRDLARQENWVKDTVDERFINGMNYGNQPLLLVKNASGEWRTPVADAGRNTFDDVTVKVLQAGEGEDTVIYIYASMLYEPKTLEGLMVIASNGESEEEADFTVEVGKTIELTYNGKKDNTTYDSFEWELADGGLSNEILRLESSGRTCRIEGLSPGKTDIVLYYSYGIREPDVLTGIERTGNHEEGIYYVIEVK